jgi:hypothetical protein
LKEEEELILALGQSLECRQQNGDVVLLLPLDDSRWMFPRAREIGAGIGALDLGKPLRAAADRTDGLIERRTESFFLPGAAQRTGHLLDFSL